MLTQNEAPEPIVCALDTVLQAEYDSSRETPPNRYQKYVENRATMTERRTNDLLNSTLWHATPAFRRAIGALRRRRPAALAPKAKAAIRGAGLYINQRPNLRRLVLSILNRVPSLKLQLARVIRGGAAAPTSQPLGIPTDPRQLYQRAWAIYIDMKAAVERNKDGCR